MALLVPMIGYGLMAELLPAMGVTTPSWFIETALGAAVVVLGYLAGFGGGESAFIRRYLLVLVGAVALMSILGMGVSLLTAPLFGVSTAEQWEGFLRRLPRIGITLLILIGLYAMGGAGQLMRSRWGRANGTG